MPSSPTLVIIIITKCSINSISEDIPVIIFSVAKQWNCLQTKFKLSSKHKHKIIAVLDYIRISTIKQTNGNKNEMIAKTIINNV